MYIPFDSLLGIYKKINKKMEKLYAVMATNWKQLSSEETG